MTYDINDINLEVDINVSLPLGTMLALALWLELRMRMAAVLPSARAAKLPSAHHRILPNYLNRKAHVGSHQCTAENAHRCCYRRRLRHHTSPLPSGACFPLMGVEAAN